MGIGDWIITVVFALITTVVGVVSLLAWGYALIPWPLAVFAIICCLIAYVGIGYYIASIRSN